MGWEWWGMIGRGARTGPFLRWHNTIGWTRPRGASAFANVRPAHARARSPQAAGRPDKVLRVYCGSEKCATSVNTLRHPARAYCRSVLLAYANENAAGCGDAVCGDTPRSPGRLRAEFDVGRRWPSRTLLASPQRREAASWNSGMGRAACRLCVRVCVYVCVKPILRPAHGANPG